MPTPNYRLLLAAIGNDAEVASVLLLGGMKPPALSTIKGWRKRNTVPGKWVPVLLAWAQEHGVLSDLRKLMEPA
jgi:hypothetical protein